MKTAIFVRVTRITLPKYCHMIGLIHMEQAGQQEAGKKGHTMSRMNLNMLQSKINRKRTVTFKISWQAYPISFDLYIQ